MVEMIKKVRVVRIDVYKRQAWKNARGPAQVVYDCPQIVIVNKPAGLAVDGPEDDRCV